MVVFCLVNQFTKEKLQKVFESGAVKERMMTGGYECKGSVKHPSKPVYEGLGQGRTLEKGRVNDIIGKEAAASNMDTIPMLNANLLLSMQTKKPKIDFTKESGSPQHCERCHSPLIIWKGFIADGHHRYAICQKLGLPFKTEELYAEDEDEVVVWMIDNQIESRRNIETAAKIRLGLRKKSILSKKARERQACGQGGVLLPPDLAEANKRDVRDIIAKGVGIGHGTVDKFEYIEKHAPKLADDLCAGKVIDNKKLSIDGVYRDLREAERKATLKATEFPKGKYRVIYADPPWDYGSSLTAKNTATPDKTQYLFEQ